ncbi:hypothetical protein SAMN06296241_1462 [Salinimicrobium sediminis]|uniref:Uncharacterized protein n=1 Tax=Salinimicrobium sediminis TaxID=1343891 RepID=A0A285X3I4_9FLAO|nr:hypothetical protein [Salinimicrobium sediminis]SOC79921.1 hypothetical protein SAMN06296241_1462 [Salinimicrobium sediminis]
MIEQEDNFEKELAGLYSKTLILMFAILFSTIFAAALLMVNLRSLGKNKPTLLVGLFAFLFVIATAVAMQAFSLSPSLTIVANVIGAAILNEFFWNKYIGSDFPFKKKSWVKPTLISIAIAMIFFLILMGSM